METAYENICDQFNQVDHFDTNKKPNNKLFHGNTSFAGLKHTSAIKTRGSTTKQLTEEIEKGVKIILDAKYEQNPSKTFLQITKTYGGIFILV